MAAVRDRVLARLEGEAAELLGSTKTPPGAAAADVLPSLSHLGCQMPSSGQQHKTRRRKTGDKPKKPLSVKNVFF